MKTILVIGGRTTDDHETEMMNEYAQYFVEDVANVEAKSVHFDQLSFVVAPGEFTIRDEKNQHELSEYDLIIFRGKIRANSELAYCISRYCDLNGIRFFNDYTPYRPASKLSQAVTFFELGARFAKTVYSLKQELFRESALRELSFPMIVKDSYGAHGNNNYLVRNEAELDNVLVNANDVKYIAQEFFPNDCDYRVLCIGEERLVIRRKAQDDTHLNNTSQGGSAEIVSPDFFAPGVLEIATQIAQKLHMGIAGVDLLYNEQTGDFSFLEVNSQPQLSTGAFPEEKRAVVSRYIASLLS